jgi:hypothetical protein
MAGRERDERKSQFFSLIFVSLIEPHINNIVMVLFCFCQGFLYSRY